MKTYKKILGILFTVFFLFSAAVQFNDPDSLLWIALYALGAVLSALFVMDKLKFYWPVILGVVYIILSIYHWPAEFEGVALKDGMKTENIELGRESLGMIIGALIMLFYTLTIRRKETSKI